MSYKIPWHPGPGFVTPEIPFSKTAEEPAPAPPTEAGPPAEEEAVDPPPLSASEGVHPFSISPEEGLPAIPQDQLLKKLAGLASLKLGAITMYTIYADVVRAPFRDALYAHFTEHAAEERAALYDVNMVIVAFGGTLETKSTKIPPAQGIQEVLTNVLQFEKQLIVKTRDLLTACGEFTGLRLMLEEHLLADQKHALDARRMLVTLP